MERLLLVADDLEYLLQSSSGETLPTHAQVRYCAGILRRLLIDGQLKVAIKTVASASYGDVFFEATDLDSALSRHSYTYYAWAGGASYIAGAQHGGFILSNIPESVWQEYGTPEAYLQAQGAQDVSFRSMRLDEVLKSTALAVRTDAFGFVKASRREVIQYVANKKGGIHFDPKRPAAVDRTRLGRKELVTIVLDIPLIRIGHLSGPEWEILSIASSLVAADVSKHIMSQAKFRAPEEYGGDPREIKFMQPGGEWATMRR